MGVYNNNKDGTRSTIANTIQVVDAPMEQFVSKGEFNAVVPSDTSADNKLVNSDTVDTKLNDIWKVQGELGAKNLLRYPYDKMSGLSNGVAMVVNSDGSITLNGQTTNNDAQNIIYDLNSDNPLILKEGTYKFVCEGLDYSINYNDLLVRDKLNSWATIVNANYVNPVFTITEEIAEKIAIGEYKIQIKIGTRKNKTADNITIYPMIYYAEDTDTTWQPYSMTNQEITDVLKKADGGIIYTGIVCWGDSLTAGGGWTTRLAELSGLDVYNAGTGGENSKCIMARQGGDVMVVDGITIPATKTAVTIASRASDNGISTQFGNKVMPLLQGGTHVNPVTIGDITGTLTWTGSNYADQNGTWTFTRATSGEEIVINRPTAIRTNFDINHNGKNELMIIFMGQNGGWNDSADLIHQHKLMIDHFKGKEYVVLGLSSGTAASRADYEAAMKEAFGRRFISLREYLAHPIYENGEIISCYGLADQNLTPTSDDLEKIAIGQVPSQLLIDSVHYTVGTRNIIGEMLYKKIKELNIL